MDKAVQREIEGHARSYRLRMPERQRVTLSGDVAGRRTGSSIEYQDRKDYVPGDDVRHVDWRAFARTDRLTVKLYREEITPRVDVVVDTSRSMTTSPEKAARAGQLALFCYLLAQQSHAVVQVHDLGQRLTAVRHPFDLEQAPGNRVRSPLPLLEAEPVLRRGGVKVLISDFLFPCEPRALHRAFRGAERLILIQLLASFEAAPEVGGPWRLQEAETGEYLDLALDRETVRGYVRRLTNLQEGLERQMRVAGGSFARVRDRDTWPTILHDLLRAGMIEA